MRQPSRFTDNVPHGNAAGARRCTAIKSRYRQTAPMPPPHMMARIFMINLLSENSCNGNFWGAPCRAIRRIASPQGESLVGGAAHCRDFSCTLPSGRVPSTISACMRHGDVQGAGCCHTPERVPSTIAFCSVELRCPVIRYVLYHICPAGNSDFFLLPLSGGDALIMFNHVST